MKIWPRSEDSHHDRKSRLKAAAGKIARAAKRHSRNQSTKPGGRNNLAHGVSRGSPQPIEKPRNGAKGAPRSETLSPRSGAPCPFHAFPALTRWAIVFRPTDSGPPDRKS